MKKLAFTAVLALTACTNQPADMDPDMDSDIVAAVGATSLLFLLVP